MVKLYAESLHIYEDRETKRHWWIPAGEWREVPDDIARFLVEAHPNKLKILRDDPQIIRNTEVLAAPVDREMKPRRKVSA